MKKINTFTKNDSVLEKKIAILIGAVDKVYPSYKQLMLRSFVQGVFVALGTTVGLSIVAAILTFAVHQLQLVPFFKQIIINSQVEKILPVK